MKLLKRFSLVLLACMHSQICHAWTNPVLPLDPDPSHWDEAESSKPSLNLQPVLEKSTTTDHLTLRTKHFVRDGAPPLMLVHGMMQNDRTWDSPVKKYNFARYMHAHGFDVWVVNVRGAGTAGFKSDAPTGSQRWTIDDLAIYDMPVLIQMVRDRTGQAPWVIGHSLGAWTMEGYLAGLDYDSRGKVQPDWSLGEVRQSAIKGLITLGGVYNLWWQKSVHRAIGDPIRTEEDFYHSNYELELGSGLQTAIDIIRQMPTIPTPWLSPLIAPPISEIPWVGGTVAGYYKRFVNSVISTSLITMFHYPPNVNPEVVRLKVFDGNENLSPYIVEQAANAIQDGKTCSYYHANPMISAWKTVTGRPNEVFEYASVREQLHIPLLFAAGGRDRLTNAEMIYKDGFQKSKSPDKTYLYRELIGHDDLVMGLTSPKEIWMPIVRWMRDRN